MKPPPPFRGLSTVALLMALAPAAAGQLNDLLMATSVSWSASSPEVTGVGQPLPTRTAASLYWSFDSQNFSEDYAPSALGLIATDEVTAVSHGDDVFPPWGITEAVANNDREIFIEYTVDRLSFGEPGYALHDHHLLVGGPISSCIFGLSIPYGNPQDPGLLASGLGVSLLSEVDALSWGRSPTYPVYFSVDAATATRLSQAHPQLAALLPNCILKVSAPNIAPGIWRTGAQIGLGATDAIDALSVDKNGVIVFSLAPGSPTLSLLAVTPGDLLAYIPQSLAAVVGPPPGAPGIGFGSPFLWGDHGVFRLTVTDNLNGTRIGDPLRESVAQGTIVPGPPCVPGGGPSIFCSSLRVNGWEGGRLRRVPVGLFSPVSITFDGPPGTLLWLVFQTLGIPQNAAITAPFGLPLSMAFDGTPASGNLPLMGNLPASELVAVGWPAPGYVVDLGTPGAPSGSITYPPGVPFPLQITMQALVVVVTPAGLDLVTSNAVTADFRNGIDLP